MFRGCVVWWLLLDFFPRPKEKKKAGRVDKGVSLVRVCLRCDFTSSVFVVFGCVDTKDDDD